MRTGSFTNTLGMSQGVLSPMLTAFFLNRAEAELGGGGSGSGSAGGTDDASSGGNSGAQAWRSVWFFAAGLAFVGAAFYQVRMPINKLWVNCALLAVKY